MLEKEYITPDEARIIIGEARGREKLAHSVVMTLIRKQKLSAVKQDNGRYLIPVKALQEYINKSDKAKPGRIKRVR